MERVVLNALAITCDLPKNEVARECRELTLKKSKQQDIDSFVSISVIRGQQFFLAKLAKTLPHSSLMKESGSGLTVKNASHAAFHLSSDGSVTRVNQQEKEN